MKNQLRFDIAAFIFFLMSAFFSCLLASDYEDNDCCEAFCLDPRVVQSCGTHTINETRYRTETISPERLETTRELTGVFVGDQAVSAERTRLIPAQTREVGYSIKLTEDNCKSKISAILCYNFPRLAESALLCSATAFLFEHGDLNQVGSLTAAGTIASGITTLVSGCLSCCSPRKLCTIPRTARWGLDLVTTGCALGVWVILAKNHPEYPSNQEVSVCEGLLTTSAIISSANSLSMIGSACYYMTKRFS